MYVGHRGETDVAPPRFEGEAEVDGSLVEPEWSDAALLTGFSQYQPVDRRPARDTTQVLVWYSSRGIYFGVRAFEATGPVNATLADRDRIQGDDWVQIVIDTFDDRRQALVFGLNPLGIQSDGVRNEREGTGRAGNENDAGADLTPDFVFESRGRLTDYGYEIEVFIPFKSISYQAADAQDWGINVLRRVQHSGYTDSWTAARRASASFLAQSGRLTGLRDLERGMVVDFTPSFTTALDGAAAPRDSGWRYDSSTEVGGDVRVGISANLTLDGTVNPDFSQVETDVGQLTSNQRFALFFPEKRPFFLEGIDRFETPNQLIYTRRLADPVVGAKLTGKAAGLTIGLLSAVDGTSASASGDAHPVYNILRLRRDVGSQSTVGLAYTDRVEGRAYNRVLAGDVRWVFADLYSVQFQGGASVTRADGNTRAAPIWEAIFNRNGRRVVLSYRVTGIHPDFEAGSGFINRPGVVSTALSNGLNWYGRPGALVERWTPAFRYLGWWDYRGAGTRAPVETKTFFANSFALRGGWSASVNYGWESYAFEPERYADLALVRPTDGGADTVPFVPPARITDVHGLITRVATPEFASFSASLGVNVWQDVGFAEARGVHLLRVNAEGNWRPTDQLRLQLLYSRLRLDRRGDGSNLSTQDIPRIKIEYQLTRAIFLRLVGQYDSDRQDALRDPRTEEPLFVLDPGSGFYVPTRPYEDNGLQADVLFSYRPNPGTVVFVGYGSTSAEPEAFSFDRLERSADRFFLKLSYRFRR